MGQTVFAYLADFRNVAKWHRNMKAEHPMTATEQLASLRPAGFALLATGISFMIGAGAAAYFRRLPLPTDPLEQ
ncbi:MAG: hypothetical protein NZP34_12170, partial [Caldilineales bacterium]|nr:hypothetical protein [Caldilineales bacterium]